jgi:hypothetical protein
MLLIDTVTFYRFSNTSLMIDRPNCMLNIQCFSNIHLDSYRCTTTYDSFILGFPIITRIDRNYKIYKDRDYGPNKYEFKYTIQTKRKK